MVSLIYYLSSCLSIACKNEHIIFYHHFQSIDHLLDKSLHLDGQVI